MWSDERINEYVRERVREARTEQGATQEELAEVIGKNRVVISDIERGRVNVSVSDLSRIASHLNKPVSFFFPPYNSAPEEMEPAEAELHMAVRGLPPVEKWMLVQQVQERKQRYEAARRRAAQYKDQDAPVQPPPGIEQGEVPSHATWEKIQRAMRRESWPEDEGRELPPEAQ